MDAASAQQLAASIQVLAAAAAVIPPPAAPPAPAALAADPLMSPTREVPLTSPLGMDQVCSAMVLLPLHPSLWEKSMLFNFSLLTSRQEPRCVIGTIQPMVS